MSNNMYDHEFMCSKLDWQNWEEAVAVSSRDLKKVAEYSWYFMLQDSVQLVSRVLESSLKVSVLIGLVFITFGYSYSFLLLSIYGGPVLTDGSGTLYYRL